MFCWLLGPCPVISYQLPLFKESKIVTVCYTRSLGANSIKLVVLHPLYNEMKNKKWIIISLENLTSNNDRKITKFVDVFHVLNTHSTMLNTHSTMLNTRKDSLLYDILRCTLLVSGWYHECISLLCTITLPAGLFSFQVLFLSHCVLCYYLQHINTRGCWQCSWMGGNSK